MLRLGSDRSDTIVPSYAEPLHSFILVVAGYEPIGSDVTGLLSNLTLAVAGQAPFGRCQACCTLLAKDQEASGKDSLFSPF
jgi:hypothetical protein